MRTTRGCESNVLLRYSPSSRIVCCRLERSSENVLPFTANGHFSVLHVTDRNHGAGGLVNSPVSFPTGSKSKVFKRIQGIVVKVWLLPASIITACKRSLRRLCFYTCLSVCTPPPAGTLPGTRYTPSGTRYNPPDQVHLPGQVHPRNQVPHPGPGTPLGACQEIRATSGRYASYWNAFLLY